MLVWHDSAWEEYLYWQSQDKKTLKRINALLKDIQRSPFEGTPLYSRPAVEHCNGQHGNDEHCKKSAAARLQRRTGRRW